MRGWKAPNDQIYVPVGKPDNVLPVIEGLKLKIEHSNEMGAETQKIIQRVKRQHNPMFLGGKPDRTIKIMNKDQLDESESRQQVQKSSAKQQFRKRGKQKIDFQSDHIDIVEEGDPTPIMRRMKIIEEQFMNNPMLHDPHLNRKKETKEEDKV